MPETFIGMPNVTRRGFVKGTAAVGGTAAVTNAFLFDTLDGVRQQRPWHRVGSKTS